jgi:hypothetical protein
MLRAVRRTSRPRHASPPRRTVFVSLAQGLGVVRLADFVAGRAHRLEDASASPAPPWSVPSSSDRTAPATTADLLVNWQHDPPPGVAFVSGVMPNSRGSTAGAPRRAAGKSPPARTIFSTSPT